MAKALIEEDTLTAIGDAIRSKGNTTELLKPSEMAGAIRSMVVGEQVIPDSVFTEGWPDNSYRFYATNNNWLLENYADYFEPLSLAAGMFMDNNLETIPITLKASIGSRLGGLERAFYYNPYLTEITNFSVGENTFYFYSCPTNEMFQQCYRLRTIPDNIFGNNYDLASTGASANYKVDRFAMFRGCYSLRKLPNIIMFDDEAPRYDTSIYHYMCYNCYVLDEITNLPVSIGTYNDNMFAASFKNCYRLKNMTFAVNEDGTAKTANWANQYINLADGVGYTSNQDYIYDYNSGIVGGQVKDDSSYWRYKDTDYWWASSYHYSRYDKASAVATINSLPDTSAYLATNGGTNTILFYGNRGTYTDAGPINSLTEEEIAVASAKGWTVAIS